MIAFIKGKVFAFKTDYVILDNQGIGYRINFNHPERLVLNQEITLYTYQHVREDEISLFGFIDVADHDVFLKLLSVKGLGPKTALNILSFASADQIIQAIETNDLAFIKKFPGVGNKTASQIILDLKGKLVEVDNNKVSVSSEITDALEALKSLGYKAGEISFLTKIFQTESLTSDEYVKMGLKLLMNKKRG